MTTHRQPLVWYIAAGYPLPAGIEAHVLHYATELRHHGFDTRVVVFKELPAEKHRFWQALEDRGISIRSVYTLAEPRARRMRALLGLPWLAYTRLWKRRRVPFAGFRLWTTRRAAVREFNRLRRRERPDLLHIFGRLPSEVWECFPPERTIYHEMMTGTVDRHWTADELEAFRAFAGRVARYFAPGSGVADNVRREFKVTRRIDPIFTMCPDEAAATTDHGLQTTDHGRQTEGGGQTTDDRGQRAEGKREAAEATAFAVSAVRGPWSVVRRPAFPRFGVICRLTGQKGISYLLEALKQFRDRHGDVRFTFAGIGPMEEKIRGFVAANDLRNVNVVPVVQPADILKTLDVFVHPSIDDAMPVAIAEALMCGVPCVVCRVGGCADLVRDGEEGFVIEPRRSDQVLDRMERFAAMSVGEFAAFRQRARARYEAVCRPASVGRVVAEHYRAILQAAG